MNDPIILDSSTLIRMGDAHMFEQVFLRYYAPLCQFALRYVRQKADSEDVVETLFISLWNKQETFLDMTHARAYLYRATYHSCLNLMRGQERSQNREEDYALVAGQVEESCLNNLIRSELIAHIYREIEKLPPHYARVLHLSYQDGLKNEEIARELDLSVQTVKNYKNKGLALLKERLPKDVWWVFGMFSCLFF